MNTNRRSRARFKTDITVKITLLEEPETCLKGRLADLSAHGLSLITDRELPARTAVRVEWGDTDFVGEVIYSRFGGREYVAGIAVEAPVYDTKVRQSGKSLR
jgi:hypothetical protein